MIMADLVNTIIITRPKFEYRLHIIMQPIVVGYAFNVTLYYDS
jgi:hypothetical protein